MRCHRMSAVAAALLAAFALCSHANAAPAGRGSQPPLREGNIYGHEDHQATSAEETAAGLTPTPANTTRQVEREVRRLLRQTDRLDRQSDEEIRSGSMLSASQE
jgi:hypothetical protein